VSETAKEDLNEETGNSCLDFPH